MSLKTATFCFLNLTFKVRRSFSGAICVLAFSLPALAWGPNGHRIVGQIAQNHLNSKAAEQVKGLLGETLAQASTWADDMRNNPKYKHVDPWHYVEIPNGMTYETSKKSPKGDLLKALREMESTLRDEKTSSEKKSEALRFFVHFVGDLHQPLHVGRGNDRGGNSCFVKWMHNYSKSNLHEVWDSNMIESQDLSFTEYTSFLDNVSQEKRKTFVAGDFDSWVKESMILREKIYPANSEKYCQEKGFPPFKNQPLLSYDYRFEHIKSLEEQLQKGGLRLAEKLNSIWK